MEPHDFLWIDTHAHLNDERFDEDVASVVERATEQGVGRILVIGIDAASSRRAVELAGRFAPVHAVVGIQPNSLGRVGDDDWQQVLELLEQPKVVGLGETGLDRYWDLAPFDRQIEFFLRHLELAVERDLPVVIHCREAESDVVGHLREFRERTGRLPAGVMHSYTGSLESAAACVELGFHVSFAGMVTFKKNDALRAVAASIPADRLLVETDAPYLAPHPHRGERNEPALVRWTGACLAEVRGVTVEELAHVTRENALRLFRLP